MYQEIGMNDIICTSTYILFKKQSAGYFLSVFRTNLLNISCVLPARLSPTGYVGTKQLGTLFGQKNSVPVTVQMERVFSTVTRVISNVAPPDIITIILRTGRKSPHVLVSRDLNIPSNYGAVDLVGK